MELTESISILDYKFQFVKNNKYWDYNQFYDISINGQRIHISENDILLSISRNIASKVNKNFTKKNSIKDYEIPNMDIEEMKRIVVSFFLNINPNLSNKLAFILSKIKFIKYDDNIPSSKQRSVTNQNGIKFYYKNDLSSLVTLAHEISHGIANLDDNCEMKNDNKVSQFAEIESELTEDLFLEFLKNNNLQVRNKNDNDDIRALNDNDIDDIKYNKYKSVIFLSYRAIDELEFKNFIRSKKINYIDDKLIDELSSRMNIKKEDIILKIERFINEYYPGDDLVHNYIGAKDYDLRNGKHLSNECRFIYAYCFIEKLNNMNLNYKQKCVFYKNYLENAKSMSFQAVLELFNVDLSELNSFSDEFISKFNKLSNIDNDIHRKI